MKNQKSLFQLIDKLKEIDVNEVIERSKNISIEDLKSIRLQDITSSKFFKPLSGIGLSIIFLLLCITEISSLHFIIKFNAFSITKMFES